MNIAGAAVVGVAAAVAAVADVGQTLELGERARSARTRTVAAIAKFLVPLSPRPLPAVIRPPPRRVRATPTLGV